uniref:Uncharacterized protein MANES_01G001600 n=1 Tax=Rhizophora mucronata TaxID=61149 RepID=A0A2P2JRV0_RHIMU
MPLKILVRLLQCLLCTLNALVHKQSKTLGLASVLINTQRTILNLPILPKKLQQLP